MATYQGLIFDADNHYYEAHGASPPRPQAHAVVRWRMGGGARRDGGRRSGECPLLERGGAERAVISLTSPTAWEKTG